MAYAASDDNAFPWIVAERRGEDSSYVVASIKTDQAELSTDAMLNEVAPSHLDGVRNWLGIPRSRDPEWVQADHEHTGIEIGTVHVFNLGRTVDELPLPDRVAGRWTRVTENLRP